MQKLITEDCILNSCNGFVKVISEGGGERMVSTGDILLAGDLVTFDSSLDIEPLMVAQIEPIEIAVAFNQIVENEPLVKVVTEDKHSFGNQPESNEEGSHSFVVVDYENTEGKIDAIGIKTSSIPSPSNAELEELLLTASKDEGPVVISKDDIPAASLVFAAADEDDIISSSIVSGTLDVDFGADGAGDITFSSANLPVTSSGNQVHYQILENGHQLRGYVVLDGDAYEMDVFISEVDPVTGSYTFQLLAAIDHPDPAFEDDVLLNLVYTVSDSDGDMTSGVLAVTVNDGFPVINSDDISVLEGNLATDIINFSAGADGATLTLINGQELLFDVDGWSELVEGEFGTLKVKADGSYEYTAQGDDPYISAGQESFEITVTDADGDQDSAITTFSVEDVSTVTTVSLSATLSTTEDSITYTAALTNVANTDVTVTLSNGQSITIYAVGTDLGGSVFADGVTGSVTVPLTISTNVLFSSALAGADRNQILVDSHLLVEDTNISDGIGHVISSGGVIGIDNTVIGTGETIVYKFGDTITGSASPNYTITKNLIVNDVALNLSDVGSGSDTFSWTAYKSGLQVGAGSMTVGDDQNGLTNNLSGIIETGTDSTSDGLIHVDGGYDQLNISVTSGSIKVAGVSYISYTSTDSISAEITGVSQANAGAVGTFEDLNYDPTPAMTTILEPASAVGTEPTATGFNATINNSSSETIDILNIDWSTDGPGNVAFGFSGDIITHNGNSISWSQADYNLDGLMDFYAVDDVTLENVFGIDSSVSGYSFTVYSPVDLSAPEQLTISSSGVGTNTYAIGSGDTVVAKNGFTGPTLHAVDTANTDVNISAGGIGIKTIGESTSTSFSPGYSIGSGEQIELEFASLTNDLNFITTNPAAKYFWQAKLDGATVASGNETNEITAASGFDSLLIVGNGGSGNRFAISQMEYQDLGSGGSSSVNLDFHADVMDANGSSVAGDFHMMLDTTSITQLLAATPDNVFA